MGLSVIAGLLLLLTSAVVLFILSSGSNHADDGSLAADPNEVAAGAPGLRGVFDALAARMDNEMVKSGRNQNLSRKLERAGSAFRAGEWAAMVVLGVVGAVSLGLIFGGFIGGLLAGVVTWFGFRWYLNRQVSKRSDQFGEQLPESLQIMSGSLRSGLSLLQTMDIVSKESQSPTAEEFKRVMAENRIGRDLTESLRDMAERLQSEDFTWVVGAVEINREVGGDLAEILDRVGQTIRQRERVRGQAKALSAEGRLSGYTLMALPIIAFVFLGFTRPDYVGVFTSTLLGMGLFGLAITMMLVGGLWLRSLINVEL